MDRLAKLRTRIAALRAKTTGAGCTEAEALAAAEMAARLMAQHGLSDDDITMGAARAGETTVRTTWRTHIAGAVATATNTAAMYLPDDEACEFIGYSPGPDIAAYLYEVLVGAVMRESAAFRSSPFYRRRRSLKTRRAAMTDYREGMVRRLRSRLVALFAASRDADASDAAHRALAIRYPDTVDASHSLKSEPRYPAAAAAGWSAGGKVTLAHGVAGPDGRLMAIEGGWS